MKENYSSSTYRTSIIFSIFILLMSIFLPVISAKKVSADQIAPQDDPAKVDKVANELKDVSENINYDQDGVATSINVDTLANEYGDRQKLTEVNNIITYQYARYQAKKQGGQINNNQVQIKSFWGCMKNKLIDYIGINAYTAAVAGGLKSFISKKAWKAAAKLIIKTGIKGLGVAAIAAQLAYDTVVCA